MVALERFRDFVIHGNVPEECYENLSSSTDL